MNGLDKMDGVEVWEYLGECLKFRSRFTPPFIERTTFHNFRHFSAL